MSGLLRRIKRARAAGGEPSAEGAPTATGGAPATPDPAAAPAGPSAAGVVPAAAAGTAPGPATAPAGAAPGEPGVAAEAAAALPAGVDPSAPPLPPKGRRSRLRKRLRYLRRARELMLRDLGGLLYEIHRTGGGQVDAHAGIIGAKVARLAATDQEAHAIEAALGAPRGESAVFEPGVGGACTVCGELYPSGARFCSHCGTATAAGEPARGAGTSPAATGATTPPVPATGARAAGDPATGTPPPRPAAAGPAPPPEPPTSELSPAERSPSTLGLAPASPGTDEREPDAGGKPDEPGAMNGHAPPADRGTTDPLAAPEARRP